jgi:hypothetical protein
VTVKWERVGKAMPTDKWVYNIRLHEIKHWIESQPIHMWKHYDIPINWMGRNEYDKALWGPNYLFTDEMEAWFMLRWS